MPITRIVKMTDRFLVDGCDERKVRRSDRENIGVEKGVAEFALRVEFFCKLDKVGEFFVAGL